MTEELAQRMIEHLGIIDGDLKTINAAFEKMSNTFRPRRLDDLFKKMLEYHGVVDDSIKITVSPEYAKEFESGGYLPVQNVRIEFEWGYNTPEGLIGMDTILKDMGL